MQLRYTNPLRGTRLTKKEKKGVSTGEQYLTIAEVAERLKLSPKTVSNKMASGAFRQGVHYFRRPGMKARFKWSAVVEWLEAQPHSTALDVPPADRIPMARGYVLGGPQKDD
jgi:excisionase family DNA binding protein